MNDAEWTMAKAVYSLLIWVLASVLSAFTNDASDEENVECYVGWNFGLFLDCVGNGDDDYERNSEILCGVCKIGTREDERKERGARKRKRKRERGLIIIC